MMDKLRATLPGPGTPARPSPRTPSSAAANAPSVPFAETLREAVMADPARGEEAPPAAPSPTKPEAAEETRDPRDPILLEGGTAPFSHDETPPASPGVEFDVDLSALAMSSSPPASSAPASSAPDRSEPSISAPPVPRLDDLAAADLATGFELTWPPPPRASAEPAATVPDPPPAGERARGATNATTAGGAAMSEVVAGSTPTETPDPAATETETAGAGYGRPLLDPSDAGLPAEAPTDPGRVATSDTPSLAVHPPAAGTMSTPDDDGASERKNDRPGRPPGIALSVASEEAVTSRPSPSSADASEGSGDEAATEPGRLVAPSPSDVGLESSPPATDRGFAPNPGAVRRDVPRATPSASTTEADGDTTQANLDRVRRQHAAATAVNRMTLRHVAQGHVEHPDLGRVHVAARRQGDDVDVALSARESNAVAVLQSTTAALSSTLRQAAVDLRDIHVRQDHDGMASPPEDRGGQPSSDRRRDARSAPTHSHEEDPSADAETRPIRDARRSVRIVL
ncbi:MAG: hypothetical protein AAF928_04030 [Myxococcota bacterium]